MAEEWCRHRGEKVLLVEGVTDCHVVLALCKAHKVPKNFGIYECGSDHKVLQQLNALISAPTPPNIIGVLMDADSPDLAGRWRNIESKLKDYDYTLPTAPEERGTIVKPVTELSRLGFWLMPNNRVDGMLEDFCIEMIEPNAIATVVQCLQIAEDNQCTSFKPVHRSKAIVHTYLAWQDEPGKPLGQSITAHNLRPETETAKAFIGWLTELFRSHE